MVSTTDLPLCKTRVLFAVGLFVACTVGGGPILQLFMKHASTVSQLNKAVPSPIKVKIRYTDVEIIAIFLFVSAQAITSVAVGTLLFLCQDVFHFAPAGLARRFKLDKQPSSNTLKLMAWVLVVTGTTYVINLTILTVFVFKRSATIVATSNGTDVPLSTIQSYLDALKIKTRYRDTPYIFATTQLTWIIAPVVFLNVLVMFIAAKKWARIRAAETPAPEPNAAP